MKKGVSCIIAAYNEEERIGAVIDAALHCPEINEVIVVNDGSTDNTKKVIDQYPTLQAYHLPTNQGKAYAVSFGVSKSTYDILVFVDSDLEGLRAKDLAELITPVIRDNTLITLSMRKNSFWLYRLFGIDFVTGERVLHRSYFEALGDLSLARYGIEVLMNKYILSHNIPFQVITWKNVSHPMKKDKRGLIRGTLGDILMIASMIKSERISSLPLQLLRMSYRTHLFNHYLLPEQP